jgi:hypothetical protein
VNAETNVVSMAARIERVRALGEWFAPGLHPAALGSLAASRAPG